MNIYIDTNVWLNLLNARKSTDCFPKAKDAQNLFKYLEKNNQKVSVVFSYFNWIELSSLIRDSLINLRLLGKGYPVFRLKVARDKERDCSKLTNDEDKQLARELAYITSLRFVKPLIDDPQSISGEMMEEMAKLIGANVEMPDAIHVIYALINNCNYFVTCDKALLDFLLQAQKEFKSFGSIKVIQPKDVDGDFFN